MNIKDINISSYYYSDNYGVNAIQLELDQTTLYFSYNTIIAIHSYKHNLKTVRENKWSNTTGKHINHLKDRGFNQVDDNKFNNILDNLGLETFASNKLKDIIGG